MNSSPVRPWLRRILRWLGAALATVLVASVAGRALLQARERERRRIDPAAGIDLLERITIGGVSQWLQIRGQDRRKPLLVWLHGGPGFPQMPFEAANRDLERDFVVVHWDQRGAGKSYHWGMKAGELRVEQFVNDAHELVTAVLKRLGREKCFLVAHSWGTIIGAIEAARHPELFHAYVGVGQIAEFPENERARYDFAVAAATKDQNEAALQDLRRIGPPPHPDLQTCAPMERWVSYYAQRDHPGLGAMRFVRLAFSSPDYSTVDLARIPAGYLFSYEALWREIYYDTNLFQRAPRIAVPVWFFLGRHDKVAFPSAVQRYCEALEAPAGKEIVWFEASAHWPFFEEPATFHTALRRVAAAESVK